jgi:hypothetical protein
MGWGMRFLHIILCSVAFLFVISCQKVGFTLDSPSDIEQSNPYLIPGEQLPPIEDHSPIPSPITQKVQLAWESAKFPDRLQWSQYVYDAIETYFVDLDLVQDADRFCPNYYQLNRNEKINFWGQLFASISYFESGWNPTTRFKESTMGVDPVTNQPVYSEGLLQLSYQDTLWAKWCEFDWSKDRILNATDPKKSIFDPKKNLECGVGIMARQIRRTGNIILSSGAYWAVIKENGRYQKINQIANIVRRHAYCN